MFYRPIIVYGPFRTSPIRKVSVANPWNIEPQFNTTPKNIPISTFKDPPRPTS